MSKEVLISIFEDTFKKTKNYENIYKNIEIIKDNIENTSLPAIKDNIVVTKGDTFEIASEYKNEKVCAICFSSGTNAGGGVRKGSSAQEESMCRASSLYHSLTTNYMWENFYNYHRKRHNALYTNRFYHIPFVKIIKDNGGNMLEKPFECGVIGVAAPNLREIPSNYLNPDAGEKVELTDEELYDLLLVRYSNIVKYAELKNYDVLILGAIGCGAFRNSPYVVARVFKDILSNNGGKLKKIVFAIYDNKYSNNYEIFKDILCK